MWQIREKGRNIRLGGGNQRIMLGRESRCGIREKSHPGQQAEVMGTKGKDMR